MEVLRSAGHKRMKSQCDSRHGDCEMATCAAAADVAVAVADEAVAADAAVKLQTSELLTVDSQHSWE